MSNVFFVTFTSNSSGCQSPSHPAVATKEAPSSLFLSIEAHANVRT